MKTRFQAFAFKFNVLYRYAKAKVVTDITAQCSRVVGLDKFNPVTLIA